VDVDSASSDGGGGYVIGEEVAKRKMISQSSGGSRLGVCRWLAALVVDSVVAVTMVMVSIDIMVFFVSCMKFGLVVYNDDGDETDNYSRTSDRERSSV
jgi:hypothetical protein